MTAVNTATDQNELADFAEPSYGGGRHENWSLKEDSSALYRPLPAHQITPSLAKSRDYAKYWATHFWKGRDPRNPEKTRFIPIFCLQQKDFSRGGMVVQECPLCKKREVMKKKIAGIEAAGIARTPPATKAQIAKATAPYQQWLKEHGHDGKYRIYAVNAQEQVGILRLASRAMSALRDQVKKLVANGHSPLGVHGIWFEFTRVGNGGVVPDKVEPARDERPDGSSVLRFHDLKKPLWETAREVLPDFDAEIARITYSMEKLQELADSNDDPDEVNRILGIQAQEQEAPSSEPGASGGVDEEDVPFSEGEAVKATTAPVDASTPSADDEEAVLQAQMAALKAKKAAAAAAAKAAAAGTAPSKPEPKSTAPAAETTDKEFDDLFPPAK